MQRNLNVLPSHPEKLNHTDPGDTVRLGRWVTQLSLWVSALVAIATPYAAKKNPVKFKLSIVCFPLMNIHVWWSLILFQKFPSVNLLPCRAESTCLWFDCLWLDWQWRVPHLRVFQLHTNNRLKKGHQVSSRVAWTWLLPQFWEEALFYVCFFLCKSKFIMRKNSKLYLRNKWFLIFNQFYFSSSSFIQQVFLEFLTMYHLTELVDWTYYFSCFWQLTLCFSPRLPFSVSIDGLI